MMTFRRLSVLALLISWIAGVTPASLRAQGPGITPVPGRVSSSLDASNRPVISWEPVSGHGPQDGLLVNTAIDYNQYNSDIGSDQYNWQVGDPSEVRRDPDRTHTNYLSSYGVDVFLFNTRSGPDGDASIFCLRQFSHTPLPFWPGPAGGNGDKAKFDQVHYFHAGATRSQSDLIDLSPLGVTHPDQLLWFPGTDGYPYSYLMVNDNDGDFTDVAAAVLLRADRMFGEFSLTEHIIYAEGQTTYCIYRRLADGGPYQQIACGLTGTSYVDTNPLLGGTEYEYVVTANAMFGESAQSGSTTELVPGSLPVEWMFFEAELMAPGQVQLAWATATESNSARFEVERSLDGRSFTRLGAVAAAGQSSQPLSYQFTDARAPEGALYYRLRQVDLNGATHYSEVRQVRTATEQVAEVRLYPNPAQGEIHLAGLLPQRHYHLRVVDQRGRTVHHDQLHLTAAAPLRLALHDLPPGLYQVLLSDPAEEWMQALPLLRQ